LEKEKNQRHTEPNKKLPKAATAAAVAGPSGVDVPKRKPEKKRKRVKKKNQNRR